MPIAALQASRLLRTQYGYDGRSTEARALMTRAAHARASVPAEVSCTFQMCVLVPARLSLELPGPLYFGLPWTSVEFLCREPIRIVRDEWLRLRGPSNRDSTTHFELNLPFPPYPARESRRTAWLGTQRVLDLSRGFPNCSCSFRSAPSN